MMLSKVTVSIAASAIAGIGLLASYATPASAQTGTWADFGTGAPRADAFPGASPDTALLLTDGSVIMHDFCTPNWFRLLPNNTDPNFANSYITGQWSTTAINDKAALSPMIGVGTVPDGYGPLFYSSVVLPDGRVVVQGGEAENSTGKCSTNPAADSTKGSLLDPNSNTWTSVPPPPTWTTIGDAMGILLGVNNITGAYSPASYAVFNCCQAGATGRELAVASITPRPGTTFTWTRTSQGKTDQNAEEGWVRLPNGQLLSVNVCFPTAQPPACTAAQRFDPGQNPPTWLGAGNTPATLVDANFELGPGVGIGFNMAVWFGATDAIALYQYPTGGPAGGGTWTAQNAFPAPQSMADAPAALLPSGNILVQTGPGFNNAPSSFFEFNSSTLSPTNTGPVGPTATVNQPQCNSGTPNTTNVTSFQGRMVLLPTGQVLWDAGEGVNCTSVYTSNNIVDPNPVMRPPPHITTVNGLTSGITLSRGSNNNTLTGSMFRGWSQGATYGDDAQSATDFPIVMITNNGTQHRCFGRTHDWAILTSAQFDIPPDNTPQPGWALIQHNCETGPSTLKVIVNGRPSNSIAVTVN
jgi:hypothetical protein